jgi:hypothetical protein
MQQQMLYMMRRKETLRCGNFRDKLWSAKRKRLLQSVVQTNFVQRRSA